MHNVNQRVGNIIGKVFIYYNNEKYYIEHKVR